jgi:hypothetical protein
MPNDENIDEVNVSSKRVQSQTRLSHPWLHNDNGGADRM